ncbi:2-C-methyl-D-erythritol 4-phosphate cytidylyltransferase [Niabella sp. CC-SYL272]|uniref:2-C-methyl-D-erythritol 4-phosphate cytidylyltransferase n=1 Tax=Niabella agricola TaxID=2891571 RepID=UPI001F310E37|nr:2-C-methyl-D-erythritol 4-phosphate cytidylyltransferase [Niabella agricola]MCF3107818.1 2-C-methyl-D-erythritol 4-phosphate cytidylyltransferase [Niabella agricola]
MKKTAVIVAGGSGVRMGAELPKQFLLLKNKPLLYYTIDTFLKTYEDLDMVLVLPEAYTDMGQEIIDAYFDKDRVRITIGGATRFESVKNGLKLVEDEAIIFVHDAVRCLVSPELIRRCYEQAVETGSAIPVVAASDSVRLLTEDGSDALDRGKVVLVQTPQVFHSKLLIPAFSIEQKEKFTDEASVVEAFGMKVSLVEGEKNNIKVTHPPDLVIAEQLLNGSQV